MRQAGARGFTMLEVLVAILILSLGLLGLAGLQTMGLRNNTGSSQRTIATQLAYDIADRMRANYGSVILGDYNFANYGLAADARSTTATSGAATATCFTTTCTSTQLAYQDLFDWNQQICTQLPQTAACVAPGSVTSTTTPYGVVCIDSTPNDGTPAAPACDNVAGGPYVIKIWWIEDRNNPTLSLKQWVTSFQP